MSKPQTERRARAGTIVKLPRALHRAIVVEPAPRGLWLWRLYHEGRFAGIKSEAAERVDAVRFAQEHSRAIGIPAFFRPNVYAKPLPMRRRGQF